jgi:hypothetical protein
MNYDFMRKTSDGRRFLEVEYAVQKYNKENETQIEYLTFPETRNFLSTFIKEDVLSKKVSDIRESLKDDDAHALIFNGSILITARFL